MKRIALIILFGCGTLASQAQTYWSRYTSNLPGVRAYSFAGVVTANINDQSALYYNPAALGMFTKLSVGASAYLQLGSSSFSEEPSVVRDATVETRSTFIRLDQAGIAVPIEETGFTLSLGYFRHQDRSFYEEWNIEYSGGADDNFTIDVSGGLHDVAVGFGKGWGEDDDLAVSIGSSYHSLFGSVNSEVQEPNGLNKTETNYRGGFFRHGFMMRGEKSGIGLMLETPHQVRESIWANTASDTIYRQTQYGSMVSIGSYIGGDAFRFHAQYDYRFQKDRKVYQASNLPNYLPVSNFGEENIISSFGVVLESGEPNLNSLRYSFRYATYPQQIDEENVISYLGVVGYGGLVADNLSMDISIGFEFFPRHLTVDYTSGDKLVQQATYWRIGMTLTSLGFDKY